MTKDDLKCVLIGRDVRIYSELATLVRKVDVTSRFKQVSADPSEIVSILKKINGPSLIFVSDEISFSLEMLSDLVWQYNADSIVVIVSRKARIVPIKYPFNNTQFSRIKLNKNNSQCLPILQFLIQSTREKSQFRRCKSLLGVSEKRCQWLVDSSREAIAFISRDMHWYANTSYIDLFGISSISQLRSITVKDLIIDDEHSLFDSFKQKQVKGEEAKRSLTLSMKKLNGSTFRANAYLIPSVYKSHKCHQLWVREINSLTEVDDVKLNVKSSSPLSSLSAVYRAEKPIDETNPFAAVIREDEAGASSDSKISTKENQEAHQLSNNTKISTPRSKESNYDQKSLLKGIIRRKEARIVTQPLSLLKENALYQAPELTHQMLSLKVAAAQKKGIDDLLINLPKSFNQEMRSVFWDKVKFTRLLHSLIDRKQLSVKLLIRVNEASIIDESFIDWLIPGLKRLGDKSNNLVLLIPSNMSSTHFQKILLCIKKLKSVNCKIALDSFSINKNSTVLLKHAHPDYIRLSLPWTRQLQGDEIKEIRLSGAIRKLEHNNIKVIAPCAFSKDMRKLFILSGASFCQ